MAKYLEDRRRRLQGQQSRQIQGQTGAVQKQPIGYTPKTTAPVQTQAAAPATVQKQSAAAPAAEKQTYTTPQAPAEKHTTTTATAPAQTTGGDVVAQAQDYLNQQLSGYNSRYGSQITDLVQQLQNRPAFEYNAETDPLYIQLRDIWKQDGLMAMEDTMGQAAHLTGGYGNSYAQTAGQQVYNNYLSQVNEMIPELEEAARADYDAKTNALLQQYSMLMEQDSSDYSRWLDEINRQYQLERDALSDQRYDQEWAYQTGRNQLEDERYQDELGYSRQQQSYDRLLNLIIATGYQPTAEELAAAGMTEAEAKAWRGYYTANQAVGSSYDGGYDYERSYDPADDDNSVIEQYQILAGQGVSKEDLLAAANEDLEDGIITKQEFDQLAAWIDALDDNPNEPVMSGYTGAGARDLGMPLHARD